MRDIPPGVGSGGRDAGRPRPPTRSVAGPKGSPVVSEQGSKGGTGRGLPGGDGPKPVGFREVGPGGDDGGGRGNDSTPAREVQVAAFTVIGFQEPRPRTMEQVVKEGRFLVVIVSHWDARVRVD